MFKQKEITQYDELFSLFNFFSHLLQHLSKRPRQ